jgi:signal transduction histidine kinase/ActR/RegA family two-component response regulator
MDREVEFDERILILAPIGRDAKAIADVVARAGSASSICADVAALVAALGQGASAALVAEEALIGRDIGALTEWVDSQPPWSDMPFVILTGRDVRPEMLRWRHRLLDRLRNASLLERPLDSLTLSSVSSAACRSRQRQYEVRAYIAERSEAAANLERLVASRTQELETANEALRVQMAEREKIEDALRQAQKMEAVGQLTGGLAHDFNNMLAGISGSLEIMQTRLSQGRTGDIGRYVTAAAASASRAAALTHRLLAFSRRQTLSPKPTDANALIEGMGELIRGTAGPAIHVQIIRGAGLWMTLCDPNQLENALLNLVINARDAMPDGGTLTLEAENARLDDAYVSRQVDVRAGQYVMITVADTGTGMQPEIAARAFDPFFTTKPIGEGTGLGLSMVYGFAKQSAGHVRIASELGAGTEVRLYLPRHHGEAAGEIAPPATATPRAHQGETVLVVDDETTLRMLICEVLSDLGYEAIQAADAHEGLRILRSGKPVDLLITDVGLPNGMNGRQLADAARGLHANLRVLFITGYAESTVVRDGQLAPGMEVITKPFALHKLAAQIRGMVENKEAKASF